MFPWKQEIEVTLKLYHLLSFTIYDSFIKLLFPSSYPTPLDLKELNVISLSFELGFVCILFELHLFTDLYIINLKAFNGWAIFYCCSEWLIPPFFRYSEHKLWTQSLISYLLNVTTLFQSHMQQLKCHILINLHIKNPPSLFSSLVFSIHPRISQSHIVAIHSFLL